MKKITLLFILLLMVLLIVSCSKNVNNFEEETLEYISKLEEKDNKILSLAEENDKLINTIQELEKNLNNIKQNNEDLLASVNNTDTSVLLTKYYGVWEFEFMVDYVYGDDSCKDSYIGIYDEYILFYDTKIDEIIKVDYYVVSEDIDNGYVHILLGKRYDIYGNSFMINKDYIFKFDSAKLDHFYMKQTSDYEECTVWSSIKYIKNSDIDILNIYERKKVENMNIELIIAENIQGEWINSYCYDYDFTFHNINNHNTIESIVLSDNRIILNTHNFNGELEKTSSEPIQIIKKEQFYLLINPDKDIYYRIYINDDNSLLMSKSTQIPQMYFDYSMSYYEMSSVNDEINKILNINNLTNFNEEQKMFFKQFYGKWSLPPLSENDIVSLCMEISEYDILCYRSPSGFFLDYFYMVEDIDIENQTINLSFFIEHVTSDESRDEYSKTDGWFIIKKDENNSIKIIDYYFDEHTLEYIWGREDSAILESNFYFEK